VVSGSENPGAIDGGVKVFAAKIGRPEGIVKDSTGGIGWNATFHQDCRDG
jgi:hypothetical protein